MLPRLSRSPLVKRTVYTTFGLSAAYLADTELNASAVTRNLRTLWTVRQARHQRHRFYD
jgi:aarF domain-containing kinase